MLEEFGPGIWIAGGPVVTAAAGFRYPTRMAVIRLTDGNLVVWSPVECSPELRSAVGNLGTVRWLVAPNSLHHVFLADWKRAFPDAHALAPPGLREKRRDIAFDGDLGDAPVDAWSGQLDHVVVRGNRITTEVVFFHRASRTAIFCDLIQHFPRGWFGGWRSLVARLDLMTAREAAVPRKFRVAFTDRGAARVSVGRILEWPVRRVLFAHGAPVAEDGQAFLRRAFRWLMK